MIVNVKMAAEDIPALVAEVRRLRARVAAVEGLADQYADRLTDAEERLAAVGVLAERFAIRGEDGSIWLDTHGNDGEARPGGLEFASRGDAEVLAIRPLEEVMRRLVTPWEVAP